MSLPVYVARRLLALIPILIGISILVFMLLLMNDRELMGDQVNSRWYNIVSWFTVAAMAALSIALLIAQARG